MSDNIGSLVTPEDYINHYYPMVKERLSSRGLQISKVGFIGFFLNLLGFTQYDTKMYYDTLFREAFLATADDEQNLGLHGIIYGYSVTNANPASVTGTFTLSIDSLPPAINVESREIEIESLEFTLDEMIYTLDATYIISGNICEIRKKTGEVIYVPFNQHDNLLPIVDLLQYTTVTTNFTLPFYVRGTHYQKIIEIGDLGQVYDIQVLVKDIDSEEFEEYEKFEVRSTKYFTTAVEKVVFIRYLPGNKILVEFGSGIHGKYVTEAEVQIVSKVTFGSAGNISQNRIIPSDGNIRIYESGGGGSAYNVSPDNVLTAQFEFAEAGADALSGDELRNDIIAYVQTRDNMLSERDFYNILDKYIDDCLLMFKKTNIVENIIYTFLLFRNKYKVPVLSKSISVLHDDFNEKRFLFVYKPSFTLDGVDYISPFFYRFDTFMRHYNGYIYYEVYSTYFSKIEQIDEDKVETLPLSLHFEYRPNNNSTRITAQSYQPINQYVMYLSIPILEIYVCMDVYNDNIQEYYHSNVYGGIIDVCMDVSVEVYFSGNHIYTFSVNDVCLMGDISDILTLKTYEHPRSDWDVCGTGLTGGTGGTGGAEEPEVSPFDYVHTESHILNIPVMLKSEYDNNVLYYDQKFIASLGSIGGGENRLISDDLQVRFLNTEIIKAYILNKLTVQQHNFDITLPLKLVIDVTAYKQYVLDNNIDTLTLVDDLKANLATKLYDNYTGTHVSFYRTQIVDVVHNLNWVKHCDVTVFDSSNPQVQIPQANFETKSQIDIIRDLDKYNAVTYCPVYIWWDLDNIEIVLRFE